jgi:membrane fusion protein (multidrug efflux system)
MQPYRNLYILLIPVLAVACKGKQAQHQMAGGMPKVPVTVFEVKTASYTVTESFPAVLTGNNTIDIRSDVTGFLQKIHAKDGSSVSKGQALYEVDKSRSQAAYDQANAAVIQAEADLALKKRDLERYSNLLKKDAISKQTVDQATTAVQTSEALLAQARATRARSGTDISHAVLRAPIAGKIGIAQLRIGDLVTAGSTVVNTLVNEDPIFADIDIPQTRYNEFRKDAGDKGSGHQYYLTFPGGEPYPEPGKILLVNNAVDAQTGTIRVRLTFPNKSGQLKSGMTASLQMHFKTGENQVAIPAKSIIELLSEVKVYTLGPGNVVEAKPVQKGSLLDSLQIINSGLQPGDKVITDGLQKIRPGDTVIVK